MTIDQARLWNRLEALSEITDPERPWTRRSFTLRFLEGRDWLAAEFRAAGLETAIDAAGNLIGRLPGSDPALKPILIGSHSDTVPSGGRYDGILGVLAGLEVAQSLAESGQRLRHPLEIVDFLAEEPSEFGLSCIGSRGLAGALSEEHLALRRPDGMTLREGIAFVGGRPEELASVARPGGSVAAYVEVHIEQGRVLESEAVPIGIVTDIVGIRRERITVTGRADHAGATPMPLRADALVGASRLIEAAYRRALATARDNQPLVATFGRIEVSPNAANAVPGEAVMILEVRSGDEAAVKAFGEALVRDLRPALEELRLTVTSEPISHVAPTACAQDIRKAIADASASLGLATRDLPSGAGHDGVFVARTGPIGMIFVPCLDGRSHAPEESITPEQAGDGTRVLAQTLRLLDTRLS
ncbi:Zn-dependent hydrolase [Bosea rubneri]|uniref:Zn-dependent hydrolase n=1 Tax=Bosea rubneri TaxID=3075434 RepID=A0ABU3S2L0_9HYPH|nr:Zn-dependent hydrolase [Bosea sp. ZW T0_25]MDU0338652.1 Zn-dependent hydrolase [Bosea sp. ZW T0_25]